MRNRLGKRGEAGDYGFEKEGRKMVATSIEDDPYELGRGEEILIQSYAANAMPNTVRRGESVGGQSCGHGTTIKSSERSTPHRESLGKKKRFDSPWGNLNDGEGIKERVKGW